MIENAYIKIGFIIECDKIGVYNIFSMTAGKIRRKQRGDGRPGVSVAGAAVIRA